MDWAQILIISLTVFLAVVVVVAIILVIYLIKLTNQIKTITKNAENTARNIEDSTKKFNQVASSFAIAKTLFNRAKKARKNKEDKGFE